MVARGAAYADYDKDGDTDILITENNGPAHLWRNDGARHNYLRITVEGRSGNRDGLGTRIVLLAGRVRQERRVRSGSSYLSQNEFAVTFGLSDVTRVDSLWVHWPLGVTEVRGPLEVNQELHIVEGEH